MRILLKRWYILVPLLVLTAAATIAIYSSQPLVYRTKASLVLLPPSKAAGTAPGTTQDVNPWLYLGGSQETAAHVLVSRMTDKNVGKQLVDAGVVGPWTLDIRGDGGPLIEVVATEGTSEQAANSALRVLEMAKAQFADIQLRAGSPQDQLIQISDVSGPSEPQAQYGGKRKAAATVGVVGLALALLETLGVEYLVRRRAARSAGHRDDGSDVLVGTKQPVSAPPPVAARQAVAVRRPAPAPVGLWTADPTPPSPAPSPYDGPTNGADWSADTWYVPGRAEDGTLRP